MIQFHDWEIAAKGDFAHQFDNLSRTLLVSGDLPDGWEWSMLVQVGEAMDILHLEPMEGGVGLVLTADQLSKAGYYQMQLRGRKGEMVRHTNMIHLRVPKSLTGDGRWPTLPSEFSQAEARISELNSHPPVPGEGFWMVWNPETDRYEASEFPLTKQVNADWNQNDPTQPDYVKNRTHYEETKATDVFPATTLTVGETKDEVLLPDCPAFAAGETYVVTWNGTEYKTICFSADAGGTNLLVLGNHVAFGGADTGEPFLILQPEGSNETAAMCDSGATITVSIRQEKTTTVQISTKFLPASVPWVEESGGPVEVLPERQPAYNEADQVFYLEDPSVPALVVGETYTVRWNGTDYDCTAMDGGDLGEAGTFALGNIDALMGTGDSGEPFVIMVMPGLALMAMAMDGSTTLTLSIYQGGSATVNKLDNRCLDLAWLPTTKEELKEVYPETTMTFTYGGSQFFQAYEIPIELVVGNWYVVRFEETEYTCEAKVIGDNSVSIYYIGNLALSYPNEPELAPNTGEPFVYFVQDVGGDGNGARFYIEGEFTGDEYTAERTIAVYAVVQVPNKLPAEFLPQAAPVADVTAAPTAEDFNALLASLRAAGYLAQ